MDISLRRNGLKKTNVFKYLLLAFAGPVIIILCSFFQLMHPTTEEYYYSDFLRSNYLTVTVVVIFIIIALAVGYFWRLNPWIAALSLFIVFPVTTLIEGWVYRGSHNLLPFEFLVFFCFAVPSIIAMYIGRYFSKNAEKQKLL